MNQKKLLLLLLILTYFQSFAQQDPQFTNYYFNQLYLNPAVAGSESKTLIQAIYRNQYVGYQGTYGAGGSPVTQLLSANIPLKMLKGGIGVHVTNDQIGGGTTNREMQVSYAYQLPVGGSKLSIGAAAGLHNTVINGDNYIPRDPNDPAIPSGTVSQFMPDFAAGVYLFNSGYSLGLSMKHLTQPQFDLNTATATNPLNRSVYLSGSFLVGVSYTLDITPMFVVKSDLKTISPEAGFLATYNNRYYLGANYRWEDAVSFLVGGKFLNDNLRIGYAFDWVLYGVTAKSTTSHEIVVGYALSPPRAGKKSIVRTPRYRF